MAAFLSGVTKRIGLILISFKSGKLMGWHCRYKILGKSRYSFFGIASYMDTLGRFASVWVVLSFCGFPARGYGTSSSKDFGEIEQKIFTYMLYHFITFFFISEEAFILWRIKVAFIIL